MPEPVVLSGTLWLVVAPPVVGFVSLLARQLAAARGATGRDPERWSQRVGMGSVVLSSGATLGHALRIGRAGGEGLSEPLGAAIAWSGAGSSLIFDTLSATACGLACAVAMAVAVRLARRPVAQRSPRLWMWLQLALGGALLSFLADGFLVTLLGWTAVVASGAWLAGWTDPRSGAARATRGALAVVALLFGAVASSSGAATGSLVAVLVAVAAMSASTPPPGAPLAPAALACGASGGLVGPYLLLRLTLQDALAPGAAHLVMAAGGAMLVGVALGAWLCPPGAARWLAVAGGAPAGATCISLGADGVDGGLLVLVSAALAAALLLLAADARKVPDGGSPAKDPEAALLRHMPEAAGHLLSSFERWIVDAIGGAAVALAHASAWALSKIDARRP
jgi:hypothetical protein